MASFRILVCGGRDWLDKDLTYAALDAVVRLNGPIGTIIHGATIDVRLGRSADWLAEDWAIERGVRVERYGVDHTLDGAWPAAGHRRNRRMLREAGVHGGIAFPGHKGTQGMCALLHAAGIPVWKPYG